MHNKTYCQFADTGLFFSHRGPGFCCDPAKKYPGLDAQEWWNSEYRKQALKKMKNGEKVDDCTGCYKLEEKNELSNRIMFNKKQSFMSSQKALPRQIDLDLSNFCNLKCIMCSAERSSQWAKEKGINLEKNGVNSMAYDQIDKICALSHDLEYLQIQGGEPSIMPEYDYYFEYLHRHDLMKNIEVSTITNLTNLNNKFFKLLEHFKRSNVLVSIDSHGTANDYIRYPSSFSQIEKNLIMMSKSKAVISLQIALETISMFNFDSFLYWMARMTDIYKQNGKTLKIFCQKVYDPHELCIYNAPTKLKEKFIADTVHFFSSTKTLNHNHKFKIEMFKMQKSLLEVKKDPHVDVIKFIENIDKKRNIKITDYVSDFYNYFQ